MRDLKLFNSLAYVAIGFAIFYGLYHYVFDEDFGFWAYLAPVGSSILSLIAKYADILSFKKEKGFVVLKDSPFKFTDFNAVLLSAIIIFYVKDGFILWLSSLLLVDLILIYLIKKRQVYYFGDWSIKNLSSTGKNILMKDIVSIEILANSLEIVYKNIEYDEEEDEDDEPFLSFRIHRNQLEKPRSWVSFQKIFQDFQNTLETRKEENLVEKATLEA